VLISGYKMKTYKQIFSQLNRPALIPFFVIGDPDYSTSLAIVKSAIDAGADILELGIPFSDPVADGPVIQKADLRAAVAGMTVEKAKAFIAEVKAYKDIPIGLLMYYNLVFQYGPQKFFHDFHAAGVNSVLIADITIDDADEIVPLAKVAGLDTVFMATPISSDDRIKKVAALTTGFIYTVAVLGVTGARQEVSDLVAPLIKRIKFVTDVPVCVGFGISQPAHAKSLAAAGADGVIIGSALVKIIEENLNNKPAIPALISDFLSTFRRL